MVEALVSIAIIAILSAISVNVFVEARKTANLKAATDEFAQNLREYVSKVRNGESGEKCLDLSVVTDKTECRSYGVVKSFGPHNNTTTSLRLQNDSPFPNNSMFYDTSSYFFFSKQTDTSTIDYDNTFYFYDVRLFKLANGVHFREDYNVFRFPKISYEFPLIKLTDYSLSANGRTVISHITDIKEFSSQFSDKNFDLILDDDHKSCVQMTAQGDVEQCMQTCPCSS